LPDLPCITLIGLEASSLMVGLGGVCTGVGGKWGYLWRAVDINGPMIGFRLTARGMYGQQKPFWTKRLSA